MEFVVKVNGTLYEISELVTKVSFSDKLNDGCSKLEFSYINDDLIIENGSNVWFQYNGEGIFNGFAFKVSRDKGREISVTAYDQLRYCKAKDVVVVDKDTVTTLTSRMCNYFGLAQGTLADSGYVLATGIQDNKTWLDILYSGISDTLMNKGKKYALRDEFGKITLRDLEDLQLSLVLGDGSLVYDFKYEKSIDDEFYNQIKIYIKNTGKLAGAKSDPSIQQYGLLQYFESEDGDTNEAQAKEKANMLLSLYNHEAETLSLDCLGDTSVRAGNSFYASIEDIKLGRRLIVKEAKHDFLPVHTMSLEVAI